MTKRVSKADRWALITGGRTRPLVPSEATEVSLLADLLADPSTWAEPRASLEDDVVRAVVGSRPRPPPRARNHNTVSEQLGGITASPSSAAPQQRR